MARALENDFAPRADAYPGQGHETGTRDGCRRWLRGTAGRRRTGPIPGNDAWGWSELDDAAVLKTYRQGL